MNDKIKKQSRMYQEVRKVVDRMSSALEKDEYGNERAVENSINELLRNLEWSQQDILPQLQIGGGIVDIALGNKNHGGKYFCFIEVKAVGKINNERARHKAEKQLFGYFNLTKVPFLVLTDGREWIFYYYLVAGKLSESIFLQLNISKENVDKCAEDFCAYLSHGGVTSGRVRKKAEKIIKKKSENKEKKNKADDIQSLKEIWGDLLEEKPLSLQRLIKNEIKKKFPDRSVQDNTIRDFLSEQAKKIQKRVGRTSHALQTNVEKINDLAKNAEFWHMPVLKALNKLGGSARRIKVLDELRKEFLLNSTDGVKINTAKRQLRKKDYMVEQKKVGLWELTDKGKKAAERGV